MNLKDKISQLENRDYGHDDDVENIIFNINEIIEVASPRDNKHKKEIENAILTLLEEYHYDGELTDRQIESGEYTTEYKREMEQEKLNEIIENFKSIENTLKATTESLKKIKAF